MPPSSSPRLLARRTYGEADQRRFATLSGDSNPMHVDPVVARRLLTGRQVVHGIHTLLSALEVWDLRWPDGVWRVDAEFLNPVSVGEAVDFTFEHDATGSPVILASTGGALPCCRVGVGPANPARTPLATGIDAEPLAIGSSALSRDPSSWVGGRQRLSLPKDHFAGDFPVGTQRLGDRTVAAIALLSTYVGMVCPGLHSVFSAVSLEPGDSASDELTFEVRRFDARMGLFLVSFDGALRGELRAFLRPPAQTQPSTVSLREAVKPGEFAGTRHWVIGGSRGLGELVGKLAAVGGGDVTLSHASGATDAERVALDIAAAGLGTAQTRHLDLLQDGAIHAWLRDAPWPDAVWYFATPRIFRKKAALFDATTFEEFLGFYVYRFAELCQALEAAADGRSVTVFYPSTVFVDERPKGMTEYTMAKAAAEVLIADLARRLRHVKPVARRLPRLATDQTAGLIATGSTDNTQVLLPLMRELLQR